MSNLKLSETLIAKKTKSKVVKYMLAGTLLFSSGIALTGCSKQENAQTGGEPTTEVEPTPEGKPEVKELTPLEKEISELEDFQVVDKIYDNKDLEPFNKMQGYWYTASKGNDYVDVIELIPPENIGAAREDSSGYTYKFNGYVAIPFVYCLTTEGWAKFYPQQMNETGYGYYSRAENEYKYIQDDELNKIFGEVEEYTYHSFNDEKNPRTYQKTN